MCCGKNRTIVLQGTGTSLGKQAAESAPAGANRARSNMAYFEYTGKAAMTVVAPVTGMRYRFVAPGSRVGVDLRDRRHLSAVPNLVQVRSL